MTTVNGAPANPPEGRGVHDRELDLTPVPPRTRGRRSSNPLEGHQRLVANPFLALLGTIGWFVAIRQVVLAKRLDLFFPVLASLVTVFFLFQFHCLDCGATGRLSRWRDHACEPVRLRSESGVPPRNSALTPVAQTLFWFYFGVVVVAVVYILTR